MATRGQVSPVLLENGVPLVPYIRSDVLYRIVLGSDVLALHKLLLVFSRYGRLSQQLRRIRDTRTVTRMAEFSSRSLRAATASVNDVAWLLYGRSKGRLCQHQPAAVRAAVRGLAEDAFLLNHPACLSYQLLHGQRVDREDTGNVDSFVETLTDSGLVGFGLFSDEYH
ncbi:uncharacterized protein LOC119110847 [Pollicipes pollicipes]|uniref:uncharacterized protein LOC119110847 n=1 Tax=Pollicipes pollicipes TaxID=41117 RepID=UPI001884D299|nr:uncharacterized protein LOC119110847 [Pollicipes pollicipes]